MKTQIILFILFFFSISIQAQDHKYKIKSRYSEENIRNHLSLMINNQHFVIKNEFLVFEDHNPLLNEGIYSFFEKHNIISDSSFKTCVIKVGKVVFLQLIDTLNLISKAQKKNIVKLITSEDPNKSEINFEKAITKGLEITLPFIELLNTIYAQYYDLYESFPT